ncbi:unnamed protein product [Lupinus luteus]|uniref:Uncharacterized protein n=1 Tax=Lupinus luteus TaxID=3873 RepID=A0AAV1XNL7_LUPLU
MGRNDETWLFLFVFLASTLNDLPCSLHIITKMHGISCCHCIALECSGWMVIQAKVGVVTYFSWEKSLLDGMSLYDHKFQVVREGSKSINASPKVFPKVAGSWLGVIPDSIGNLIILQLLGLLGNNLTSDPASSEISFLTSLTKCRKPKSVASSYNPLNGTLPSSIGNLPDFLQAFEAWNCNLKGQIPSQIENKNIIFAFGLMSKYEYAFAIGAG